MRVIKEGIWPAMITPFTSAGHIDEVGVAALLAWYNRAGVDGVFACCQSSEMFYLKASERLALVEMVKKHTPEGLQIIACGHVDDDIDRQIAHAKDMASLQPDALVLVLNRLAREDETENKAFENMLRIMDAVPDITLGLYECPFPYKRLASPGFLRRCADTGRFAFLKETSCHLPSMKGKIDALQGTPLKVYNANSALALSAFKQGAAGFCGTMCNFHPDLYTALYRAFRNQLPGAERLQAMLGALSLLSYQYYPVNAKYALAHGEGLPVLPISRVRDEGGLTERMKVELEAIYDTTALIRAQLPKIVEEI